MAEASRTSEARRDAVFGWWVIFSPARSRRPTDLKSHSPTYPSPNPGPGASSPRAAAAASPRSSAPPPPPPTLRSAPRLLLRSAPRHVLHPPLRSSAADLRFRLLLGSRVLVGGGVEGSASRSSAPPTPPPPHLALPPPPAPSLRRRLPSPPRARLLRSALASSYPFHAAAASSAPPSSVLLQILRAQSQSTDDADAMAAGARGGDSAVPDAGKEDDGCERCVGCVSGGGDEEVCAAGEEEENDRAASSSSSSVLTTAASRGPPPSSPSSSPSTAPQIALHCGADAAQFLLFERASFLVLAAVAAAAVAVALPLNLLAGDAAIADQFAATTISHIPKSSPLLWLGGVPAAMDVMTKRGGEQPGLAHNLVMLLVNLTQVESGIAALLQLLDVAVRKKEGRGR